MTPEHALQALREGNQRFVLGQLTHDETTSDAPFAVIHGCIDSRVEPERVFDLPPRSCFISRTAGALETEHARKAIEFAVEMSDLPLVVVLSHTDCAAIEAAQKCADDGWLDALRENIADTKDPFTAEARAVASKFVAASDTLKSRIADGKLFVVPAVYDVLTKRVTFHDPV